MTWERVAAPLIDFCQRPQLAADKRADYRLDEAEDAPELRAALEATRQRERALAQRVADYERGRFIRTMARLKGWCDRIRGRG